MELTWLWNWRLGDRHMCNCWCSIRRICWCLLICTGCPTLGCPDERQKHLSVKGSGKPPVKLLDIHTKRSRPFVRAAKDRSPYQLRIGDRRNKRKTNGLGELFIASQTMKLHIDGFDISADGIPLKVVRWCCPGFWWWRCRCQCCPRMGILLFPAHGRIPPASTNKFPFCL